ncbi:MAG: DUF4260 family protein [Acidobacteria bacterium]|nr:DUF4260 family protein [Acidobacteriota bacterium]
MKTNEFQSWLRLEAASILAACCFVFSAQHGNWWWFAALFLIPDVSMLGYLLDKKLGAFLYNLAHSYVSAAVVMGLVFAFLFHLACVATGRGRGSSLSEEPRGYQDRSCNHQFHKFSKEPPIVFDGSLSQTGSPLVRLSIDASAGGKKIGAPVGAPKMHKGCALITSSQKAFRLLCRQPLVLFPFL